MDMKIRFKGILQEDFEYAFQVLEECKKKSAQKYGFAYPYFTPGGYYEEQWWQLDSVLALSGYKWYDQNFCETSLLNFIESQCDNGRIRLWGRDILPNAPHLSIQKENVSSLPKIFDVAYNIIKRSSNTELKKAVYQMFQRYLQWWFEDRQDKGTKLITSVFEETFIPYLGRSGEYAGVDTNVEVVVGCHYTACLAEELGEADKKEYYFGKKQEIYDAINEYMWDEKRGAYFAYNIKNGCKEKCLMISSLNPLRLNIAPPNRREKLLKLLCDNTHFNWDGYTLTTVSKQDPCFMVTEGRYQGNASWSGNVWTLTNEMIVRGLLDCGEKKLAGELALKTIRAFNHNCAEFVNPFNGTGHGVERYAWSASQYLEMIIEVILGLEYSEHNNTLIISPNIPKELEGEIISLKNIPLPSGGTIDVIIDKGNVRYSLNETSLLVLYEET